MKSKKHNWKKTLLISLGVILFILVAAIFYVYQDLKAAKNVEISVSDISVSQFTLSGFRLHIGFHLYNPNKWTVTIGGFTADVFANGIQLTHLESEEFTVSSGYTLPHGYEFGIRYLDLGAALVNAFREKQVTFEIKGTYNVQLPFGITYPYTFDIQREWSP